MNLFLKYSTICFLSIMSCNATAQVDDSAYVVTQIQPIFTPDGDGINDEFMAYWDTITPAVFKMMIFDRWGDIVYQTNDLKKGWDGTIAEGKKKAKEDTYIWKVIFSYWIGGQKEERMGHIILLR